MVQLPHTRTKNRRYVLALLCLAGLAGLFALVGCQPSLVSEKPTGTITLRAAPTPAPPEATPTPEPEATPFPDITPRLPIDFRQAVLEVAASDIGTTEATGRNDGAKVESFLRSVGLKKGDPYCAAWVHDVGRRALGKQNPFPRSGWSPDMVEGGTLVSKGLPIKPASAFGIWFKNKGRVAHTGLIESAGQTSVITIEANTSPSASSGDQRNGDGVWRKKRLKTSIYKTKDWIGGR